MKSFALVLFAGIIFTLSSCGGGHKTCPTYTKAVAKEAKHKI